MTTKDVLTLALEALAANEFHLVEVGKRGNGLHAQTVKAITAIKQAQQAQEPVEPTDEQIDELRSRYTDKRESREDIRNLVRAAFATAHPAPKQAEPEQ